MKKIYKGKTLVARIGRSLAVSLVVFAAVRANAAHELMYGIDVGSDNIISFYSDAPGTVLSSHAIIGLQASEDIRGIDFSSSGVLYGLGSSSRLYTINPNTGTATAVGVQFSTILNGTTFGVDNGTSGFQVVSDLGQSLLVDRTTGVATGQPSLAYAAGDPHAGATPRIDALAFKSASGTWFAGDSLLNVFTTLNPVTGVLNTLGPAGIDFARNNGLDFSDATGLLYLASPAASSDPQANLYTVNPVTGAVTLVGQIGQPGDNILIRGLAVVVPEPSSLSLLAMGGLLFGFLRRRK
jgi:hypothetical protein